ncbi:MAG: maltose alpha-D-glucosyltransferase [Dehalococcoidia bacterium]|nr:maltose alpha-D-glucosyltransferase [Dehalococcoidia bacterium]
MSDCAEPTLWYKDAIIYELHVRAFADSNGDGIGDFRGLTDRLDYLRELGVTAIWLLPFYPSPLRDGGYDISDYTSINPDYGTMRDFTRFVKEAHARDMRVITELVVNHTSDQHPWFQRARRAPEGSAARNWYVWSDTAEQYSGTRIIFTDTETSNWSWDPVAEQHYWHRFFSHQPDLNYEHPQVRKALTNVMKFWFDRGVDGLRLDAVPYLREREGTNNENLAETHEVLREWRAFVDKHYPDRMLLAEANQWPEDVRAYFGTDDAPEAHVAFHFPIMPRLFMALRREDRHPIVDIMDQTPPIPEKAQWALFLRNHDELTLEMVTDEERDYMYAIYATDPRMRVNAGIRRRLAPLLDSNRRAIELLHGLLFALPGTPIIYYGDEIGMGDNIYLGDRDGVRTPMQWNGDRNAGFSRADPARLFLPLIMDPLYGYQAVNVDAQERSASSLLNWMRRMIALRRNRSALGRGELQMLHPENRAVLAFLRRHGDEVTLVVANLSRFVQPVELDLADYAGTAPVEVIGRQPFPLVGDSPYFLTLAPHAFYWFDLVPQPEPQVAVEEGAGPVVKVEGDWDALLAGAALKRLEVEALPEYLARQRWFGGKDARVGRVRLHDIVPLRGGAAPSWLTLVSAGGARDAEETVYVLPLAVASGRGARRLLDESPNAAVVRVRSARGDGVLFDAMASDVTARELLELVANGRTIEAEGARVRLTGEATAAFRPLYDALDDPLPVTRSTVEQSNTSVRYGQQIILKLLRRFEPEPHPEVEVGRHLAPWPHLSPRLVGTIGLEARDRTGPVAVAHEYVWNQDDGWNFTLSAARRFIEEHVGEPAPAPSQRHPLTLADEHTPATLEDVAGPQYAEHVRILGARTAQLHLALADARGDPAFEPERLTRRDLSAVVTRTRRRLRAATPALQRFAAGDDARLAEQAQAVLDAAPRIGQWLADVPAAAEGVSKIRVHGDYHLGQVLFVHDGFVILDFEGEVGLPIAERRRKTSAFADIAGMLRSFSYASLLARRAEAETYADVEPALERLAGWSEWWEEHASSSFLSGYLEVASGAPFLPAELGQRRRILDLYLLDKALHELQYELDHRPDWVAVPLEGLTRIVRQLEEEAS